MFDNIYCKYFWDKLSAPNRHGYWAAASSYSVQIYCGWSFFPASSSGKWVVKALGN